MKLLLIGFFVAFSISINAQGWLSQGARSGALANNGVTFSDVFAFHHNPGALGFIEKGTAGISYEARYMLKELQTQSIAVAVPLPVGVISVGGQFYGHNAYRTQRVGVGYALKLIDNISAGVQLNYIGMGFGDTYYGRKDGLSAELGALAKINNQVNIGFSVINLTRTKLADYKDDRLATLLRLGASYQVMEQLSIMAEIEQEIAFKTRFRFGIEYQPIELLYIRVGV